jgi:hypothetical protein
MKKYFIFYKILFLSLPGFAQLTISSGTRWVTSGNVIVNLQDMSMTNNGTFTAGQGKVKFSGDASNAITGSSAITFNELEIAKSANNTLVLFSNFNVANKITFTSGLIDLNQKTISLNNGASLNNENEISRIIGPTGGEVTITTNMNKPNAVNPGDIGVSFTSQSNLGSVTIKRGHLSQSGTGLTASINRYFNIQITGKKIKATTTKINYFDAELNGQDENTLAFYQSLNNGANWTNQSFTSRDAGANWVEKSSFTDFGLLTLSGNVIPPPIVKSTEDVMENTSSGNKIIVGPNPNNGNFWFRLSGIEKETIATLYTIDGKVIKQFRVTNLQQQQVNGLGNGMYILKVPGLNASKIVVQGSSGITTTNSINDFPTIKN